MIPHPDDCNWIDPADVDVTASVNVSRIPARPTTYNGVKMRSRLEAAYAEQFDAFGWAWEYEPVCLANGHGQYLPDFRLVLNDMAPTAYTYVEVKPYINVSQAATEIQKMTHWWSIIKANDAEAAAFVLMFGAEVGAGVRWLGLIDDWNGYTQYVCPMVYGTNRPHVLICHDPLLSAFGIRPVGPPAPVPSLYAQNFYVPHSFTEDTFSLRSNGC